VKSAAITLTPTLSLSKIPLLFERGRERERVGLNLVHRYHFRPGTWVTTYYMPWRCSMAWKMVLRMSVVACWKGNEIVTYLTWQADIQIWM
jgi:hypothetical protein